MKNFSSQILNLLKIIFQMNLYYVSLIIGYMIVITSNHKRLIYENCKLVSKDFYELNVL